MSREQKPLTARVNITPLIETIKVLDHLRMNNDGTLSSYTLVIEDLLEESPTFRKIRDMQNELENQMLLRQLANKSTQKEVLSDFTELLELEEKG